MARFLLLEHLIRLLGELHKSSAEVLHPRVRIVFWSVIVLWSGVCVCVDGSKPSKRRSRDFVSMPHPNAQKIRGGGRT